MLRGTQVRIWQPSGIGESHESLQDFGGLCSKHTGTQVVSVSFSPKLRDVTNLAGR